jgi:hypothetical protein
MISFSRDGTEVITAVRDSQGAVRLSVCDEGGREIWSRADRSTLSMVSRVLLMPGCLDTYHLANTYPLQATDNQLGLSSVFYDKNTDHAIVTAFINKSYHVVQSKSDSLELKGWSRDLVYKFQAAAQSQSPSSSIFTLADAHGQLYTLNTRTRHIAERLKLPHRCSANSRDDMMALAMPDDNTVRACWNEDGKIVLATVLQRQSKVDTRRIHSLI